MDICLQKIKEHNLDMKLIDVEYTFDNNKILFYFTADGRIDFRELVKDLAAIFKTRIELRQIGVRDETKMMGGIGICGRVLCCKGFLCEFQPVSIKMAKEQGLSLNPSKISGCCGRLMCCLKYEHEAYEEVLKKMPKVGALVSTPEGQGIVIDTNLLKETAKIKLENENENEPDLKIFNICEIKVIKDVAYQQEVSDLDLEALKELED
jgi:cell fate regulator YaaT (PSP1 superfamily)